MLIEISAAHFVPGARSNLTLILPWVQKNTISTDASRRKKKKKNTIPKRKAHCEEHTSLLGTKKIRAGNKSSGGNKTKDAHTQCMKDYHDRLQKRVTQMYNEKHRKAGEQIDLRTYQGPPIAFEHQMICSLVSLPHWWCATADSIRYRTKRQFLCPDWKLELPSPPRRRMPEATCNKLMPDVRTKQGAEK